MPLLPSRATARRPVSRVRSVPAARASQIRLAVALAVAGGLALSNAHAGGFYLQEQGVSGLGAAYAGEAAAARDAATIFFNPAGLTRLDHDEVQLGVHLLMPRARIHDEGSTVAGFPIQGNDGGNPYDLSPVPNLYYAKRLSERAWFGFGVAAPFGLKSDYADGFFARYDSTLTDLRVVNVQPSVAWAIDERLSIGAGLDLSYADAKLSQATPAAPFDGSTDGSSSISGDSWAVGVNAGLLWRATATTDVGLHVRSGIRHRLEGAARIAQPNNGPVNTLPGSAGLNLPAQVSLGLRQGLTDDLDLLAGATWFGWSTFDRIEIRLSTPMGTQTSTTRQDYRDTVAVNLGLEYRLDPRWTLRAGVQYDPTPTRDDRRSTRTPDGDRTWLALGASYQWSERLGFDVGYTYIDVASGPIRPDTPAPIDIRGRADGRVHIVSAAARLRF